MTKKQKELLELLNSWKNKKFIFATSVSGYLRPTSLREVKLEMLFKLAKPSVWVYAGKINYSIYQKAYVKLDDGTYKNVNRKILSMIRHGILTVENYVISINKDLSLS